MSTALTAPVTGATATNGLAATLTGTVANATALSNGFTTGEAYQSGTGGSIARSTANTANGDPQDGNYVKPFGISAIEVTAATGTSSTSRLTVARRRCSLSRCPEHGGSCDRDPDTDRLIARDRARGHGLGYRDTFELDDQSGTIFRGSNGSQMDLFGNFFGSSLGISTGSDGSTQLGRSSETWVMGDDIDSTTNRVTLNNHGLSTGDAVVYSDGTTADGGLTDGTTYYAIVVDTDTIQLATSVANANAGTAIVLDGAGTDDQSLTVTGDPITIAEVGEARSVPRATVPQ